MNLNPNAGPFQTRNGHRVAFLATRKHSLFPLVWSCVHPATGEETEIFSTGPDGSFHSPGGGPDGKDVIPVPEPNLIFSGQVFILEVLGTSGLLTRPLSEEGYVKSCGRFKILHKMEIAIVRHAETGEEVGLPTVKFL